MKKIKAGVIGMGFIGNAHVEALRRLSNVEVIAVSDNSNILEAKAAQLGIGNYYSDYRKLIDHPDIDCVHICTPNNLHYEISKYALEAGKHVVCEKPLTTNIRDAEELVRLAAEKGLVNAINFNLRFYPLIHQLRTMIENGEIGEIFSVNGSYLQDWLLYNTDYNWRLEADTSGESRAVADIGSHWLDIAEFVTGIKLVEVFADFATFHKIRKKRVRLSETYSNEIMVLEDYKEIDICTEDYATVLLGFENGARGAMTVSQVFAGRKNRLSLEIAGSKKSVAWNSEAPNELWIGRRDAPNESLLKDPNLMYPGDRVLASYPGGHAEGFPDTFKQNFIRIYDAISGPNTVDKEKYPTFKDGLREILLCHKIMESSKNKIWMSI